MKEPKHTMPLPVTAIMHEIQQLLDISKTRQREHYEEEKIRKLVKNLKPYTKDKRLSKGQRKEIAGFLDEVDHRNSPYSKSDFLIVKFITAILISIINMLWLGNSTIFNDSVLWFITGIITLVFIVLFEWFVSLIVSTLVFMHFNINTSIKIKLKYSTISRICITLAIILSFVLIGIS